MQQAADCLDEDELETLMTAITSDTEAHKSAKKPIVRKLAAAVEARST